MYRGIYEGATGLTYAERLYEVTAHNLANLRVSGHRARKFTVSASSPGTGSQSAESQASVRVSFEPGPIERTGEPTHVAIKGDGFFVIEGPTGELYTRSGAFRLNARGELELADGYRVVGAGGPIVVPPGGGPIRIGPDGQVTSGGAPVGRIRVVRFDDPHRLKPVTANLFEAPAGVTPNDVPNPELIPGAIEGSNVNPVLELLNLIIASRFYEASFRSLKTMADFVETASSAM